jgi:adenylate kinase
MRLALFGPPGAGKGTQSRRLVTRHRLTQVSTGDLFRAALEERTPVGIEAEAYMKKGALVPDAVVCRMVEGALDALGHDGFVLDGFPRTVEQAEWLTAHLAEHNAPLNCVVSLQVDEDALVQRLSRRRTDSETGAIYHLDFKPPPPGLPEGRLQHRADDRPEVVRKRLVEYHAETAPVAAYYTDLGVLVEVDGMKSPNDVEAEIEEVVQSCRTVRQDA